MATLLISLLQQHLAPAAVVRGHVSGCHGSLSFTSLASLLFSSASSSGSSLGAKTTFLDFLLVLLLRAPRVFHSESDDDEERSRGGPMHEHARCLRDHHVDDGDDDDDVDVDDDV